MNYLFSALFAYLCSMLIGMVVVSAMAAEKVVKPTQEGSKSREAAEWIKRCDRLKENERRACLEEVRAEIARRRQESAANP